MDSHRSCCCGCCSLAKLLIEKERRESKIREYGTKINKLWDKLQVPTDEREEFFERSTQTLGPSAVKSVRSLHRLWLGHYLQ
jgi:hypothetical protein